MRRTLTYFWRANLAVVAGAAVTTAVLAGALVVGDSVQGSLRALALERLGRTELALVGDRFFPAGLGDRLAARPGFEPRFAAAVPLVALRGAAVHGTTRARAAGVAVYGIDEAFAGLFPDHETPVLERPASTAFPPVVVNRALQRELGAEIGDPLLLSFERRGAAPSGSLLARRDPGGRLETLRLTLASVVPDRGPGRFGLTPSQALPFNAFLPLAVVQRRLGREGQINALLIARGETEATTEAARGPAGGAEPPATAPAARGSSGRGTERLTELTSGALELADLGLMLEPGPGIEGLPIAGKAELMTSAAGYLALESRELVLRPAVVETIERWAAAAGATAYPVLTHLANRMRVGDRTLPYSAVAGLDLPPPAGAGTLRSEVGAALRTPLAEDEILLNAWAAEDLAARPGDRLRMDYFVVGPRDELQVESREFRVAGVVAMEGPGADPALTPEVPGVSDAADMAAWDPPFPVDLGLVRPRDEEYWDRHRAAPKALVSLDTARRLWSSRFGDTTSIRLVGARAAGGEDAATGLARALREGPALAALGFEVLPLRERGLEAAAGSTDFGGLFIGFSLFLIVAAALLAALLFRLAVEQRVRELGLRLAVGFPPAAVRRRLIAEGAALALVGCLAGIGLAALYARAVLGALAGWWAPVVDSPFLTLQLAPGTLLLGATLSLAVVLFALHRAVRRLGRRPPRELLAGVTEDRLPVAPSRRARWVAWGGAGLAAGLSAAAVAGRDGAAAGLFFGVGAALLVSGLGFFALWNRRAGGELGGGRLALLEMAARDGARHPGRSLLCVALVASATFVLVSVGANRRQVRAEELGRDSGTGGFTLVGESDVPLPAPLTAAADWGFDADERRQVAAAEIHSLRLRPGEDASCLNLYRPTEPRLLGLPDDFLDRGGFRFRSAAERRDNPWTLLHEPLEPGVIPAVGDYNSVRWILHLGLGDELELTDDRGRPVRLRLVGLLEASIFQSELLISEQAFLEHFPDSAGFGYFLAEAPLEGTEALGHLLEERLARFGLDATPAAELLARYHEVEEMYLTTFQALGGLGLLLGTLGLGVVLIRNVVERRGELATLRAFGFRRSTLGWLVVAENAWLLIAGLAIGAAAGLLAVLPNLLAASIRVPWASLAATLGLVAAAGLLASAGAVAAALRAPLLPVLKAEA